MEKKKKLWGKDEGPRASSLFPKASMPSAEGFRKTFKEEGKEKLGTTIEFDKSLLSQTLNYGN